MNKTMKPIVEIIVINHYAQDVLGIFNDCVHQLDNSFVLHCNLECGVVDSSAHLFKCYKF